MNIKYFIKTRIRNLPIISRIFEIILLFKNMSISKIDGGGKKYPKVIQLPITHKCNSRCVMCNIWKKDYSNEMTVEEFSRFLSDPIFKEVKGVGINGGEPSLVEDLPKYANEILKLPKLTSLNIISHGFNSKRLLKSLKDIYKNCRNSGIFFHVSISLDGVGDIHDKVRQVPNGFYKTTSTINEIIKNQHKYCDSYDLGCTIINQNIDYLIELDTYAKSKNYNIKYRLGIDNKRIESDKLRNQYSVIHSPLRQSAKEFFHYKMVQSKNFLDKFKYFSIFYWLNSNKPKRLLGCTWKNEGITLDARGELYYCAVASNSIGSLRKDKGEKIFFADTNIEYRKNIIKNSCDGCIHDYAGKHEFKDLMTFFKYIISNRLAMHIYRIKLRFM